MDTIEIDDVKLTDDILCLLGHIQNDEEDIYFDIVDKLRADVTKAEADDGYAKLDVLQRIGFLQSLLEQLTGRKKGYDSIFRRHHFKEPAPGIDDGKDIARHFIDNEKYYLDHINELSDRFINEGMERTLGNDLFQHLHMFMKMRELILWLREEYA